MIRVHWKSILLVILGIGVGLALGRLPSGRVLGGGESKNGPKPASDHTRAANAALYQQLPFDDTRDFEDAKRGLIAPLTDEGVVKDAKGTYRVRRPAVPVPARRQGAGHGQPQPLARVAAQRHLGAV